MLMNVSLRLEYVILFLLLSPLRSASKVIQDFEEPKQSKAIHEIITQRKEQMSSFKSCKITSCSVVSKDMFLMC